MIFCHCSLQILLSSVRLGAAALLRCLQRFSLAVSQACDWLTAGHFSFTCFKLWTAFICYFFLSLRRSSDCFYLAPPSLYQGSSSSSPLIAQLGQVASPRKNPGCSNFFRSRRPLQATVLLGLYFILPPFLVVLPRSVLCVSWEQAASSSSCFALICTVSCEAWYRDKLCSFPNHVQSNECTTKLQSTMIKRKLIS